MYQYPYGNSQQLNLDWLINAWRQYQKQVENMIAPQYDHNSAYPDPALVVYEHKLYYNNQPINDPEEWDPDHWIETNLADIMLNWPF